MLWKNPKTSPAKNQEVTLREGEIRFITSGPRGANSLKMWAPSSVATFLIYKDFMQADWLIRIQTVTKQRFVT